MMMTELYDCDCRVSLLATLHWSQKHYCCKIIYTVLGCTYVTFILQVNHVFFHFCNEIYSFNSSSKYIIITQFFFYWCCFCALTTNNNDDNNTGDDVDDDVDGSSIVAKSGPVTQWPAEGTLLLLVDVLLFVITDYHVWAEQRLAQSCHTCSIECFKVVLASHYENNQVNPFILVIIFYWRSCANSVFTKRPNPRILMN